MIHAAVHLLFAVCVCLAALSVYCTFIAALLALCSSAKSPRPSRLEAPSTVTKIARGDEAG